jgi:hypothetical protein
MRCAVARPTRVPGNGAAECSRWKCANSRHSYHFLVGPWVLKSTQMTLVALVGSRQSTTAAFDRWPTPCRSCSFHDSGRGTDGDRQAALSFREGRHPFFNRVGRPGFVTGAACSSRTNRRGQIVHARPEDFGLRQRRAPDVPRRDTYVSAFFTELNLLFALVPTAWMAVRQTTTIKASMTAYSTAVGPSSEIRNRFRLFAMFFMDDFLL